MEKRNITPELLEEIINKIEFPEPKQIGDNLYEFRTDNFVVYGNKKHFEDVDK